MALPFLSNQPRRRDQVIGLDLGGHATKAVHIVRKGESYSLADYVVLPSTGGDKAPSAEVLAEHLKQVVSELSSKPKHMVMAIGVSDSILRQAELPMIPVADMRLMLKYNPKAYLLQDLPDHVFDCYILPVRTGTGGSEAGKGPAKCRVLVGGAKKKLVEEWQEAAKGAGVVPDQIVPGLIGPLNAFEMAQSQAFNAEIVGLVDIGFKHSTISILMNGELVLSRVVAIGGDRLTVGLSETMGIGYAEAESIKVGMPAEVQSNLEPLLMPLGREMRASVDAFEHQQDKAVSEVFISGGSARCEFIVQCLQTELMVPCKSWNPASFLTLALPPRKLGEVEQVAPQLTVAIGAAMSAF